MRVRIIKNYKNYSKGNIVDVSRNVAFGLIDSGVGELSKEVTSREYRSK